MDIRFALLADGPSDRVLLHHLRWLLERHVASEILLQGEWADLAGLRKPSSGLDERIRLALEYYPCDILFVHRDVETKEGSGKRHDEIATAVNCVSQNTPIIPVVPVRMTEAWLLFNEAALRRAAGNPAGTVALDLPKISETERLAGPKECLHDALSTASQFSGRRLRKFKSIARLSQSVYRLAELIDDFSPLLQLDAFANLDGKVRSVVSDRGWNG